MKDSSFAAFLTSERMVFVEFFLDNLMDDLNMISYALPQSYVITTPYNIAICSIFTQLVFSYLEQ